jgi:tripartite-type tricarboxylate transporter receptor subunit TctC
MMSWWMKVTLGAALLASVSSIAPIAYAQGYPSKPITLIVPFAPGGGSDGVARVLAKRLGDTSGMQIIVDNKGGAGTNIGNEAAARAKPDGYTLLLGQVTLGINPSLYPKLNYNVRDLTPVSLIAVSPTVLVVNPTVPAKSVKELVALAKAKPGTLYYGSGGNGTSVHLAGELFKGLAGIDIKHVPYKGSGPAVTDLMGGQIQMMFDTAPSAVPRVKSGSLRALAVTGNHRLPELPDVPTFAEAGYKDFDAPAWYANMGPPGMPKDVVAKLNAEIAKALADSETDKRLLAMGAVPTPSTPEQLSEHLRRELDKWGKVIRDGNIKLE